MNNNQLTEREDDEYHTPTKHHVGVTISKGNGPKEHRKATITAKEPSHAVNAALKHYKSQGYTVHDHKYLGEGVNLDEKITVVHGKPPRDSGRYTPNNQTRTDKTDAGGTIHGGTVYSGKDKAESKPSAAPAKKPSVLDRVRSSMKEEIDVLEEESHLSMAKNAKSEEEFHSHMLNHHMELMHAHKALGDSYASEHHADKAKHHADKLSGMGDKVKFDESVGNLKPGWMLKKDPELAKKVKDQQDRKKYTPVAPTLDKKYIKGTPEHTAYKATKKPINGHPTNMKEEVKTTHENPLVVVKDQNGHIYTHANLSVANAIHQANVKHQAIHTGKPVKAGKFTFELSKHHAKEVKEETMPQSFKGFLTSLTELTDKQKKIDKNHNGKLDAQDFKILRKEDAKCCDACGMEEAKCECDEMKEAVNDNLHPAGAALLKHIKPEHRNKYKAHLTTGTFNGSYKDRTDVLNAAKKAGHLKEGVNIDEAFINGREYASHGLMHPDHAKMDIHQKANRDVDFYASKTGNKMQGRVMKNDGKEVHIQAHKELGDGKLHKFKVKSNLPKTTNEETKNDIPFDGPYKKVNGDGSVKDKSGAVHTPMSRARDLARKAMQQKMKEDFNLEITEEQAADLCDVATINEKMDMSKASMGDVIKDFKKSDAPQFAGKSDEKRREMAIAAKLQADRGGKKSYREFVELLAPQIHEGSQDEKVVDVSENAFDYKSNKAPASSGRYDVKQVGNRTIVTRKYNPDTGHSTGTDDDEKPAAEKRGRGRPAGSTSGAKQKGSGNKSDYRGIDRTTHALHLPNNK